MSVGPCSEKFNIVSNDHERTQKCDFCVSVCKTNFTDHQTPDKIQPFTIVTTIVLEIWFWSVKARLLLYDTQQISSISVPSHQAGHIKWWKRLQWLDYMKTNLFKMLLNIFSTTYTYSNCIVYRLFCWWKIS